MIMLNITTTTHPLRIDTRNDETGETESEFVPIGSDRTIGITDDTTTLSMTRLARDAEGLD